jgi:hypothetical protein
VLLVVDPPSATLSGRETVTFTVTFDTNDTVFLPLQWSVTEPALGNFRSVAGSAAVYESSGARGNNAIIVKDQGNAEGLATVTQL